MDPHEYDVAPERVERPACPCGARRWTWGDSPVLHHIGATGAGCPPWQMVELDKQPKMRRDR